MSIRGILERWRTRRLIKKGMRIVKRIPKEDIRELKKAHREKMMESYCKVVAEIEKVKSSEV